MKLLKRVAEEPMEGPFVLAVAKRYREYASTADLIERVMRMLRSEYGC